ARVGRSLRNHPTPVPLYSCLLGLAMCNLLVENIVKCLCTIAQEIARVCARIEQHAEGKGEDLIEVTPRPFGGLRFCDVDPMVIVERPVKIGGIETNAPHRVLDNGTRDKWIVVPHQDFAAAELAARS